VRCRRTREEAVALGAEVMIETGAGHEFGRSRGAYAAAGARIASMRGMLKDADVVLKVPRPLTRRRRPDALALMKSGPCSSASCALCGQGPGRRLRGQGVNAFRDGVPASASRAPRP